MHSKRLTILCVCKVDWKSIVVVDFFVRVVCLEPGKFVCEGESKKRGTTLVVSL